MTTALLYFFTFSSWGLGLLSALTALSMKLRKNGQEVRSMEIENESYAIELLAKRAFVTRMSGDNRASLQSIPEELRNLISRSPNHPEVSEIEEGDQVYGVVYKAHTYPPSMDEDNEND